MVKTIFYSLAALTCKILFLPLENKIHIFAPPCNISIYYIDKSVLVENRPLIKFIRNYIRDLSGIFSISSLVRILLFVQKSSCLYNKKKVTLWLVFSRGKKIFYSLDALARKILFLPLENRIHIFAPPCNILYISSKPWGMGGKGTWVNFCWVCAAGLSEPLPHYSVFSSQFIIDPMLVTFVEIYPKALLTPEIPQMCDPINSAFHIWYLTLLLSFQTKNITL